MVNPCPGAAVSTIFVGQLPFWVTLELLLQMLEELGFMSITMLTSSRAAGTDWDHLGWAHVRLTDPDEITHMLSISDRTVVMERQLYVYDNRADANCYMMTQSMQARTLRTYYRSRGATPSDLIQFSCPGNPLSFTPAKSFTKKLVENGYDYPSFRQLHSTPFDDEHPAVVRHTPMLDQCDNAESLLTAGGLPAHSVPWAPSTTPTEATANGLSPTSAPWVPMHTLRRWRPKTP